jgi:hypothetical protein
VCAQHQQGLDSAPKKIAPKEKKKEKSEESIESR